ncbi:hypothetical protein BN439_0768 [Erwinia amylovora Ea644]|nr:hypothetical protein BN439_0768 [Erwinia amylovora Ea644]
MITQRENKPEHEYLRFHHTVFCRKPAYRHDLHYRITGMTDKWFYKLISQGQFPKPIKLGRGSRWFKSEVETWM